MTTTERDRLRRVVGCNVALRRAQLGLTQQNLADAIGVLRGTIASIETVRQSIPLELLVELAAALGLSLDALVFRSDEEACAK